MKTSFLKSVVWRNVIGAAALLIAYYIPDRFTVHQRDGFAKFIPYLLLLVMYAWIVFHNRVLFENLYLKNKKRTYFLWTIGLMAFSSMNMHFVIVYGFDASETLSKILSFWVFTITGLGVYVIFKYQDAILNRQKVVPPRTDDSIAFFNCTVDGVEAKIPFDDLFYIESLENYVKVFTKGKTFIVRMSLKETEQRLPKSFLRISRSHIVNTRFVETAEADAIRVKDQVFKIGKVYKRYVEDQLANR
jgi:hypothetical protein